MGIKEKPESPSQYDRWIQDGSVIAKLMINIVFNSVPIEVVHSNWGCNPVLDRVKTVIHEMRRYGVTEMFEPPTSWSREIFQKSPDLWRSFANWLLLILPIFCND